MTGFENCIYPAAGENPAKDLQPVSAEDISIVSDILHSIDLGARLNYPHLFTGKVPQQNY